MAYQSWSVVYGEQPSAAKWNILGTNDASFNDGTGIGNAAITPAKLSLGAASAFTSTLESTTSTSYTALATATSVTLNVNTTVLVIISVAAGNDSTGALSYVSYAMSGANTSAAADTKCGEVAMNPVPASGFRVGSSYVGVVTGLTSGSTTFALQFRVSGGTGNWSSRCITVVPLG